MERARLDPMALVYHELRAPLGLVATAARSVAEDATDDDMRSRCEIIVRAAERMLRTAEAVTRATAMPSTDDSDGETFVPHDVVRELVETLRGLDVPVDLTMNTYGAPVVPGSGARFEALIHSLVSNAIDHGGAESDVHLAISGGPGSLVIEVRNAVTDCDAHRGSGLGAIVTNALARGLGATLSAGTTDNEYIARVVLPLRRAPNRYGAASSRASA